MTSIWNRSLVCTAFMAALALGGCARSEIGEECETSGATDECVDNAVCTNRNDGAPICRKICSSQDDCATNESCNGISGTNIKSCQPEVVAP